jgi:hypothetical protein
MGYFSEGGVALITNEENNFMEIENTLQENFNTMKIDSSSQLNNSIVYNVQFI